MEADIRQSHYAIVGREWHLPLCIHSLGWHAEQEDVCRPEGFGLPQALYCVSGEGVFESRGKRIPVPKKTFIYIPQFLPHSYHATSDKWSVQWIAFGGEYFEKVVEGLGFEDAVVIHNPSVSRTEDHFIKIYDLMQKNTYESRMFAGAELYQCFTEQAAYMQKKNKTSHAEEKLEEVLLYIENNYKDEMTLSSLAEIAGITPEYLCWLFKNNLGMRPFSYIAKKRIQKAKYFLKTKSVKETAELVGIPNVSYFCRIFRQYEKITPGQFKE